MAKVKYDVSQWEDVENNHAPIGTYVLTIEEMDGPKPSSQGNQMLEVRFKPTHDAQAKKLKEDYAPIWYYPLLDHDHPFVRARTKEFIAALGLKSAGTMDTDKLKGKKVLARLKADTDQDGDYRPRIAKLMKMGEAASEPPEEEEEPEEVDAEAEEEGTIDLDSLNRTELKKLIKDEELEIKVVKSMSDEDIRTAIADAMGSDEEPEEEEEEEEEPEEEEEEPEEAEEAEEEEETEAEGDGYDDMSVAELKAELKERELPTNGARKVLVARLRKDDQGEPF